MSIDAPVRVLDLHSDYQDNFDFDMAEDRGIAAAILKLSEGPYRDGSVWRDRDGDLKQFVLRARAAKILDGAYHFLVQSHASDHKWSGRMQADLFLRRLDYTGGIDNRLLAVDFEAYAAPYSYLSPSNGTLESFVDSLRKRIGKHPLVLYSGPGFWNGGDSSGAFSQYGCDVAWTAQYPYSDILPRPWETYQEIKDWDGGPNADAPWGKPWGGVQPWFWQFTAAGRVARMNVDCNAYRGTMAQLRALAEGKLVAPAPRPAKPDRPNLPVGTPTQITAAMGDRNGWSARSLQLVREVEAKFGIKCSTYDGHGTSGRPNGVDMWIAPFKQRANSAQEALGDEICEFLEANMKRLGIRYIIWWNWMRYQDGPWFDYTPWSKPAHLGGWPGGNPDQDTREHTDHDHAQLYS